MFYLKSTIKLELQLCNRIWNIFDRSITNKDKSFPLLDSFIFYVLVIVFIHSLKYCFQLHCFQNESKRHSVAGTSASVQGEPIHMTLHEVRQYLQTLYSSSSESSDQQEKNLKPKPKMLVTNNNKYPFDNNNLVVNKYIRSDTVRPKKNNFLIHLKNKKVKDSCDTMSKQIGAPLNPKEEKRKKSPTKLFSFKQALCNLFRFRRFLSQEPVSGEIVEKTYGSAVLDDCSNSICSRALPPLPHANVPQMENDEHTLDFATSIQKVKDVSRLILFFV